jgi:membrane-associated phospholipid phosphatase
LTAATLVRALRFAPAVLWVVGLALYCVFLGLPLDRGTMLAWLALGLLAASVARRQVRSAVFDFLPFVVVIVGYDNLRGLADSLGRPTYWYYPLNIDKWMFGGHLPTVWIQEHLRYRKVQWWETFVGLTYISYFVLPLGTAAVLWLRNRRDYFRWALRYVALEFTGFVCFALVPTAPPWAAARCLPAEVANHPSHPVCMDQPPGLAAGGLTGVLHNVHEGVHPFVTRDSVRALNYFHITRADSLVREGQNVSDLVAAVPSLHSGGILLFSIFMWRRVRWWWRPLLALYPLAMTFTVVYTGEHYIFDVLTGWAGAVLVSVIAIRVEGWLARRRRRRSGPGATAPARRPLPPPSLPDTVSPGRSPDTVSPDRPLPKRPSPVPSRQLSPGVTSPAS